MSRRFRLCVAKGRRGCFRPSYGWPKFTLFSKQKKRICGVKKKYISLPWPDLPSTLTQHFLWPHCNIIKDQLAPIRIYLGVTWTPIGKKGATLHHHRQMAKFGPIWELQAPLGTTERPFKDNFWTTLRPLWVCGTAFTQLWDNFETTLRQV